mgnify:FL=1
MENQKFLALGLCLIVGLGLLYVLFIGLGL